MGTDRGVAVHAWLSDVTILHHRLQKGADKLHALLQTNPSSHGMYVHAFIAAGMCKSLVDYCKFYTSEVYIQCSTPISRPKRLMTPRGGVPPRSAAGSTNASTPQCNDVDKRTIRTSGFHAKDTAAAPLRSQTSLVLATFGWWELIEPTDDAVRILCMSLAANGIHICSVTGLPSAAVSQSLDGRYGYVWKGPLHHAHNGVGVLVALPWERSFMIPTNIDCELGIRRMLIVAPGPLLILAAYGPYVGAWRTELHLQWLQDTVDILHRMARSLQVKYVWLMGDFNLRGVAPGPAQLAATGSGHESLAHEFREMLREHSITVLTSPATHNRGGALDIHGTNVGINSADTDNDVQIYTTPAPCISDHRLAFVHTPLPMEGGGPLQPSRDERGVFVFDWSRDQALWEAAWVPYFSICRAVADSIYIVVDSCVGQPCDTRTRRAFVLTMQAIFDTIVCLVGHIAGLLKLHSSPSVTRP